MRLQLAAAATVILPTVPGAANPTVTQANIAATVCHPGWATSVRPPQAWSENLKRRLLRHSGYTDQNLRDYELDHLLSLSLGGAPRDPSNLWLQPRGNGQARRDDTLEVKLHREVCNGTLTLRAAQAELVTFKKAHG